MVGTVTELQGAGKVRGRLFFTTRAASFHDKPQIRFQTIRLLDSNIFSFSAQK
jgi:hypothetical protein